MSRFASVFVLVFLVTVAGCAGQGREPEPFTPSASPATIPEDAATAADYEIDGREQVQFRTSGQLSVAGDVQMDFTYRVNATAWRTTVVSREEDPPTVVGVYSVPLVEPEQVAATINPIDDRSPAELAALAQTRYTDVSDVSSTGNRTVTVLGSDTGLRTYAARSNPGGVDVTVAITTITHEGDVILAVGIYPSDSDDADDVVSVIEAIEH